VQQNYRRPGFVQDSLRIYSAHAEPSAASERLGRREIRTLRTGKKSGRDGSGLLRTGRDWEKWRERRRADTEGENGRYMDRKKMFRLLITTGVISIITSISSRGYWCTITHVTMSGWTTT